MKYAFSLGNDSDSRHFSHTGDIIHVLAVYGSCPKHLYVLLPLIFQTEKVTKSVRGDIILQKNGLSTMTKGAAMPIKVNAFKIFSRTPNPMILKFGMQHWGLKLFKVCMNDDAGLTLTYITFRSPMHSKWENC